MSTNNLKTPSLIPRPLSRRIAVLRRGPVGRRFRNYHRHYFCRSSRLSNLGLTLFFLFIALLLTFLPGPAILFYLLALAAILERFHGLAHLFDRIELRLRGGA